MSNERSNNYEGMFLFPQTMSSRLQEAIEHVNELLSRAGAELLAMQKWGERPLAFPVQNHRRGIYILTYFRCPTDKLTGLERDCNLSELLLRSLITRCDHMTVDEIKAYDQSEELHVEARMRSEQGEKDESESGGEPVGATVSSVDDAGNNDDDSED